MAAGSRWRNAFAALLAALAFAVAAGEAAAQGVVAHVFWREGCPHCANAKAALGEMAARTDGLRVEEIELGASEADDALFFKMLALFEVRDAAVPFVVIGDRHAIGFAGGGRTRGVYEAMVARCLEAPCPDLTAEMRRLSDRATGRVQTQASTPPASAAALPRAVDLPVLGTVELAALSLPALTVVLAGIDGFNPCAMWVLVLLIGLLAGVADARRVWTLGLAFLLVTGAMYYAVMAAWLSVVLWLGAALWLRIGIGALAVGAGLHYLREYWTNPEGVCRVSGAGGRRRFTDAFRSVVQQPSLLVATLGVAALAVAVNLVELICSAGVPVIYTQMLAMHDLSGLAYHGYLLLYLLVFLIDDVLIFASGMLALRAANVGGGYARVSQAIGGGVLLGFGAVMLLRPEWLG